MSKCFRNRAVLCVSFTSQVVKIRLIKSQIEGPNARDRRSKSAFCVFHTFYVEVQTNGFIQATHLL